MTYKLGGHIPDPVDDDSLKSYWNFGTQLRPNLKLGAGSVDLRPFSSPRHNQGNTSSCVAQAVVKALENLERQHICQQKGIAPSELGPADHENLSVLALYYLCREMMGPGEVLKDQGTRPSIACDRLQKIGVCTEKEWPYDEKKVTQAPTFLSMQDAYDHRVDAYYRIDETGNNRVQSVLDALRANHPVVYGTIITQQWLDYRGGVLDLSKPRVANGGHATHLVGWDDSKKVFLGENSWGPGWGEDGFYLLDPEVIADSKSFDFWVITGTWEE